MARIMVVEDEAIVASDITETLLSLGHAVPALAASGEEALQKLAQARPDLVLMDIQLRGELDGIATAGILQQKADLPIVFLTANADEDTIRRARKAEPYGYVVKPFHERALHGTIETALYKHAADSKLRDLRRTLQRENEQAAALRGFVEVMQQAMAEEEMHVLLEQALRRALEVTSVQVLPPGPREQGVDAPAGCATVPMLATGQVLGQVKLQAASDDYWTDARLDLARDYVQQAAAALSSVRLLRCAREEARRDGLTQLYNRRFVQDYLPKAISLAHRNRKPLSALMLDLDHFKRINDAFGHQGGDRVLVGCARILTSLVRASDVVARYGGEEFLLLLPETDHAGALVLAERIRLAVAAVEAEPGVPSGVQVRVSVGVATLHEDAKDQDTLLQRADAALYRAKSLGRDQVVSARAAPQ